MQKITVKDPYYGKYEVEIEDDAPQEVIDEVIAFMDRNCREIWAKDKYEQRHAPFSTDALVYEGEEYADTDTPESIYVGYEDEAEKLQDLQDDGSTLDELKDDSAYDYLYEELLAEIKNNLQEDFDSAEDDTDIQFEIE